jgi:hypothetical protein
LKKVKQEERKKEVGIDYNQPSPSGQQKKSTTESWFCAIYNDRFADMCWAYSR